MHKSHKPTEQAACVTSNLKYENLQITYSITILDRLIGWILLRSVVLHCHSAASTFLYCEDPSPLSVWPYSPNE